MVPIFERNFHTGRLLETGRLLGTLEYRILLKISEGLFSFIWTFQTKNFALEYRCLA